MRCLVIDDELASRSRLKRLLSVHEDAELVGEAENGVVGLEMIASTRPDVVFLDVEMPVVSGIELAKRMHAELEAPIIIFTTGYASYAIDAFHADAIGYLLKPIEQDRLELTLGRARRLLKDSPTSDSATKANDESTVLRGSRLDQIVGRKGDRYYLLRPSEVVYFAAQDGYVRAFTAKDSYFVNLTIAELEETLAHLRFFRAHRAALVNLSHVREIQASFRSSYVFLMAHPTGPEIQVSERQAKALRGRIPGL
jgi:DNA-binding LytR/AlgR family response regulator